MRELVRGGRLRNLVVVVLGFVAIAITTTASKFALEIVAAVTLFHGVLRTTSSSSVPVRVICRRRSIRRRGGRIRISAGASRVVTQMHVVPVFFLTIQTSSRAFVTFNDTRIRKVQNTAFY